MKLLSKLKLSLLLVFFCVAQLSAQRGAPSFPEFHYISLSLSGGYSSLFSNFENTKVPGMAGATFGIGYEYRYRSLYLSLGVEGQFISSRLAPGVDTIHAPMFDTEGEKMTYHYALDKWYDDQMGVYVNIPFIIGFNLHGFYMGVGAKAGMNLWGSTSSKLKYTTSATYDRFMDDFVEMPNHFYTDYVSKSDKYPLALKPNVAAIFEVGYDILNIPQGKKQIPLVLKLGAYAEYGFMNVFTKVQPQPTFTFDGTDPSIIHITPYYVGDRVLAQAKAPVVNPFYIGVKAALLFQLPVPQKCHCLQTERGASWRNNAPDVTRKQNKRAKKTYKKEGIK